MQKYCLILLLVFSTTFGEDAYDITTIVRFKNIDDILEEHDMDFIVSDMEQKSITCTAESDRCIGWETNNWDTKHLLETSVTGPNLYRDKKSILLQNNKTDPIPYQGGPFVFSGRHFGVYLGQNTDIIYSDIYFIYIYNRMATLYKCTWSEEGETIIYGSFKRACTKLWSHTQVGSTDVYGLQVSPNIVIYQQNEQTLVWNSLYGNVTMLIKYISFGGYNDISSVEFGHVKRFFSLQNYNGTFRSPAFTWRSPLLCVSISYFFPSYLTDHERKIDVTVLFYNEGKELKLGQIKNHKDNKENEWTTETFFGHLGYKEQRNLEVQLTASSSLEDSHILIHEISIGCETKKRSYEKSVIINKEASIECHSRTNALGLPLTFSHDSSNTDQDDHIEYIQPNVGVEYLTSNFNNSQQEWTLNNFSIFNIHDDPNLPDDAVHLNNAEGSLESKPIVPTHNKLCFSLSYYMASTGRSAMQVQLKFENGETLDIFEVLSTEIVEEKWHHERLVTNLSDYRNQELQVVVKGIRDSDGELFVRKVHGCNAEKSDEDIAIVVEEKSPAVGKKICVVEDEKDNIPLSRNLYSVNEASQQQDGNRIVSGSSGILMSPNHPGKYQNNIDYRVRILGQKGTRILIKFSTLFTEGGDNCEHDYVGLINGDSRQEKKYCGRHSNMDALTFLSLSNEASLHFHTDHSFEYSGFKANWLAVDVTGCPYENLTLVEGKSRYSNFLHLLMTRHGCSKNTVTAPEVSTLQISCANGGKYDNEKQICKCPPGFTGMHCETGCGENRYGRDCGGICSMTKYKCKGMILCKPSFGCTCAPGIEGIFCHKDCKLGKYGAGCTETCGHCLGLDCDKYTGVCLGGCNNGYYPPYCLETYTVLSSSPHLMSSDYTSLAIRFNSSDYKGKGTPIYYQLQFKELHEQNWMEIQFHPFPETIAHGIVEKNISGLLPGHTYNLRVVLLDKDGSSYEKEDVPSLQANTKCDVPTINYYFRTMNVTGTSFEIMWQPLNVSTKMCPFRHYEVYIKEDWKWSLHAKQQSTVATFTNKLPNAKYQVRVKAVTNTGDSNLSDTFTVTTVPGASSRVTNLRVLKRSWKDFQIHWDPPAYVGGDITYYQVSYQCLQLLTCKRHICRSSAGDVNVGTNSVTLYGLYPLAQYEIKVAAFTGKLGQFSRILELVEHTIPNIQPSISEKHFEGTNSSITVFWGPPENCSDLNGFLYGYRYELSLADHNVPVVSGYTDYTSATFSGLTPHTDYEVKVFLVTSGGWNVNFPLIIPVSTRATTPGPVENLAVYKKGRRMLGVRWRKPKQVFGDLESFKITYHKESDGDMLTVVIPPQPCSLWNNMYCHTLSSLTPEEEYVVTVSARNTEVAEDGEQVTVVSVTKEGAPSKPQELHLVSRNSTSITVEWDYPDLANGRLRSFLINLDEIDSYDASSCCAYFPIKEYPVTDERPSYQNEFTDLNPASTYSISVSAKTVMMGQPVQLSVSTHPPTPTLQKPSGITKHGDSSTMFEVTFNPLESLKELVSHYLVILLNDGTKGSLPDTQINSDIVMEQLQRMVDTPFYIAHKLNQDTLKNNQVVVLGSGNSSRSSVGIFQDPPLKTDSVYRVGFAVVLEYDGAYAVGYAESEPFFTG